MPNVPTIDEASGISLVGYHDLQDRPAFKLALQRVDDRWFLYTAHFWHSGWTVLDVTDPSTPELLSFTPGPPSTRTCEIQVAGGRMITNLERPIYGGAEEFDLSQAGAYIFDVATDPSAPSLVGHYRSLGTGTHRNFYAGGRYLFATVWNRPGVTGGSLVIVDLDDPSMPVEVGSYVCPRQFDPSSPVKGHGLHGPAYVVGDRAYASWGYDGALILDVSNVARPSLVSTVEFGDFGGVVGCHSAVPFPDRQLLVANSEGVREGWAGGAHFVTLIDISDEVAPNIIGMCPTPRPSRSAPYDSYYAKGGRFGPHNQHHHQGHPDLFEPRQMLPVTYFNAGLRIYSIEDPRYPEEIAYFVPGPPERRFGPRPAEALVTHFEDVLVDARGFLYCSDPNQGLFVLRYDGVLA